MKTLLIRKPDDWHVHFRDEPYLSDTVYATAKHFSRALVMPNLLPPLTDVDSLLAYEKRILKVCPTTDFKPYLTFYLNNNVSVDEIAKAKHNPQILGGKLYPAGATTNAQHGTKSIQSIYPLLECLQEQDMVLQIHGEVSAGDIFKRESEFIESYLKPICNNFPKLRIVLEHISTRAAVDFVLSANENVSATITPHHLMFNRNHMLASGIRPHYYCLPILKSEPNQHALIQAAISGNPKFFAGTDSAPHAISNKITACGCAGIFSAPFALPMYTEVFDKNHALNKLNDFMSRFGASFYKLPINNAEVELRQSPFKVPESLSFHDQKVVPVMAGESLSWSVHD